LLTPKGATKATTTDEIQATLPSVSVPSNVYLTVTGAGVTPVGGACQAQASLSRPTVNVPYDVVVLIYDSYQKSWLIQDADGSLRIRLFSNGIPIYVIPTEPAAANALVTLDTSDQYQCSVKLYARQQTPFNNWVFPHDVKDCACAALSGCPSATGCVSGSGHYQPATAPCFGGISVCTPDHCFDGITDGGETDVDCG